MNWFDIILLVLLVLSVLGGWKSGLVRSVFGWVALILGIVLASHFYRPLSETAFSHLFQRGGGGLASVLSFIVIFAVVVVIVGILAIWLDRLVTASILNWVNRFGGAVFGLLTGCIFLGALLAIALGFFGTQTFITESAIASLLVDKFPAVLVLLPGEFDVVRSFFH